MSIPVVPVPGGLPKSGTEVAMSMMDAVPTVSTGNEALYTLSMSDCIAIATFDHGNANKRTLTHLWGGMASPSYYEKLAATISPNTTVIVACGAFGSQDYFTDVTAGNVEEMIKAFMVKAKKDTSKLQVLKLWTAGGAPGVIAGSLILQADGKYGRIKA